MTGEELLKWEHRKGKEEGMKEGKSIMLELVSKMIADGKTEQIPRLKDETKFYEEMIKEYNL